MTPRWEIPAQQKSFLFKLKRVMSGAEDEQGSKTHPRGHKYGEDAPSSST